MQSLPSHLKLTGYNRESKLMQLESGLTLKGYDLSRCIWHCLERDTDLFVMGECLLTKKKKKGMKNSDFLSTPSPCKNREGDGSSRIFIEWNWRGGMGDGDCQGDGGNFHSAAWLCLMCCITSGI